MSGATAICHDSDDGRLRLAKSVRVAGIDLFRGSLVLLSAAAWLLPPAIREWPDNVVFSFVAGQLQPSAWQGITLFDLMMPGFLIVMGASAALSIERRRSAGQVATAIVAHLARRCIALFVIGLIIDGGFPCPWSEVRWLGPWQRVAICNFCVGSLCLAANSKLLLLLAGLVLVNYGLAFEMFPVAPPRAPTRRERPLEINPYAMEYNIAAHVDQTFLPGRKYFGSWDPCGLLTTLPALAVTLLGAAGTGSLPKNGNTRIPAPVCEGGPDRPLGASRRFSMGGRNGFVPILIGTVMVNAGFLGSEWQPWNASLLTPTFVLVTTGVSILTYSCFWLLERSLSWTRWMAAPAHVGRNALLLMTMLHVIGKFGSSHVSWAAQAMGFSRFYPQTLFAVVSFAALWCLLRGLSRYNNGVVGNDRSPSAALSPPHTTPPAPPS